MHFIDLCSVETLDSTFKKAKCYDTECKFTASLSLVHKLIQGEKEAPVFLQLYTRQTTRHIIVSTQNLFICHALLRKVVSMPTEINLVGSKDPFNPLAQKDLLPNDGSTKPAQKF